MNETGGPADQVLRSLQERAKELNCLYHAEEALHSDGEPIEVVLGRVLEVLPAGWQYPAHARPRIVCRDLDLTLPGFVETPWSLAAPIEVQGEIVGSVSVYYDERMPDADEGPFLKEERRLIHSIAARIGQALLHRQLAEVFAARHEAEGDERADWRVLVDVLARTDRTLYLRVARKMLNHLSRRGVEDARSLVARAGAAAAAEQGDENQPLPVGPSGDLDAIARRTFAIAAEHLSERDLLAALQGWLQEDRVHFLVLALESSDTSLAEIANALERFQHTGVRSDELSRHLTLGIQVSLIRRLLSDDLPFINACRRVVSVEDFFDLMGHVIQLPRSRGQLGGKAGGLFLADRVLRQSGAGLASIRVPRTWYLPSDGILQFIAHNDLEDVYNWKYQDLDQVRQEYPNLLQLFKHSRFPSEFVQGLSNALDDFGDRPLIVRSSSLLEDRAGAAFSGKYKSLFLANQGSKRDRLAALLDAVAEVYASIFGPDPIQYRSERGLLDHHEEMGIMVQEVVGVRAGRRYLPAWAAVAFSRNELRWSPRIRREDGLLRIVPGLGTRAVDRLGDDYPVLAAPGQPGLRVNVSPEDVVRYSPRRLDVIDLETNAFETVERADLLHELGTSYPGLERLVSVFDGDRVRPAGMLDLDGAPDRLLFTFDGLLGDAAFMERMMTLLQTLEDGLGGPVDLELASDGRDLYLLQCRRQSHALDSAPAPIPRDVPAEAVVFSAHRHVSNGAVPDLTHVVYVDPERYAELPDPTALREVGRVVGRLNKLLPKRRFLLAGPGRWGSRGDIRLGVNVTYSDINNTALLVEIARRRGHYVPDLSFGTHFFQDLVEASIRYLPLYPDEPGVVFREPFFRSTPNILARLLPEFAHLADVVRVIDVPAVSAGRVLRVLMNADLGEAVGVLGDPGAVEVMPAAPAVPAVRPSDDHARWRMAMALRIGAELDADRFGVRALYVFGSTKNATAGPASDLDLIVHVHGTDAQRRELELWLEGWSLCLAELNYLRTGYRSEGLLDVHWVTDADIAARTSFASKIGAVTDAARPLVLRARED